ncbi:MAG TPA: Chromate resistance protein ChrB, partial [Chloroflexota bacterium]|nr:Chromate resistance protein ChrB [Chloroflexota bacterium]
MAQDWLLLIYVVPSQPSRKRAYVWRELKRLGAVYLRDGVAILPGRADLEERLQAVAGRIDEYEGSADVLLSPRFATNRDEALIERFRQDRLDEYKELHHACVRFLRDVLSEVDADVFSFPDVDNLESELGRLRR